MPIPNNSQIQGATAEVVSPPYVSPELGEKNTPVPNLTKVTDIVTVEHLRGGLPLP